MLLKSRAIILEIEKLKKIWKAPLKSAIQMKPVTSERWQINGGDRTRQPLTARQPGLMPHFRTYQYKSKMKDALGSLPDPCTSVISTDCTVFGSEQSLTVCLRRWILPEQGLGWLGQVTWMPCIAQGAGGGLACMKHCLYYSSYPLDTGDRAAKCKLRAVKKSGVCVLTDRQLSLLLKEQQSQKASSSCHLTPEYLHTMYDRPVKARKPQTSLGLVLASLNV